MSAFTGFVQAGLQMGLDTILIKPKRGLFNIRSQAGNVTTIYPDIKAQATFEERHIDELEVTDHPVQQGAMISDHAFKRPAEVTLHLGWSNSPTPVGGLLNPAISANLAIATGASLNGTVAGATNLYSLGSGVMGLQTALNGQALDQISDIYQSLLQLQVERALFDIYTGKRHYTNMICKTLAAETDFKTAHSLPITMVCKQVILVNTQTVVLPKGSQLNPQNTASTANKGTQPTAAVSTLEELKLLKSYPRSQ